MPSGSLTVYDMRAYLSALDEVKPVIYTGDLNVAHNEIDLTNPKTNVGNPGFSYEERGKFGELLEAGFADTFRELYPERVEYSWWSYRFQARAKNIIYSVYLKRICLNVIKLNIFFFKLCFYLEIFIYL